MEITKQHSELVKCVREALGERHKFTIAIDGLDGSGKSTLARFLAWQTEIPNIETDMFLDSEKEGFNYRVEDLRRCIENRYSRNRPLIIEGVFLLSLFEQVDLKPDYLIYVERKNHTGSFTWNQIFTDYQKKHSSREIANFVFSW